MSRSTTTRKSACRHGCFVTYKSIQILAHRNCTTVFQSKYLNKKKEQNEKSRSARCLMSALWKGVSPRFPKIFLIPHDRSVVELLCISDHAPRAFCFFLFLYKLRAVSTCDNYQETMLSFLRHWAARVPIALISVLFRIFVLIVKFQATTSKLCALEHLLNNAMTVKSERRRHRFQYSVLEMQFLKEIDEVW